MDNSQLVLGLDIGIGSIGWALLDLGNKKLIDLGVRLFDVPQENKTKASLASIRRNARSARRNNQRRKDRKKHCLKLLKEFDIIPSDATKSWFQSKANEKPVAKLRMRGLNQALSKREFAQVLYSLCGHRGYIPHGEGEASGDPDGKKVLSAIKANSVTTGEKNYRTVGEMIYYRPDGRSRNRSNDYSLSVSNKMLVHEVQELFAKQRDFGNKWASEEFYASFHEIFVWEKIDPNYDNRIFNRVGSCVYFLDEKRAAKATFSYELARVYETIGHLMIINLDGTQEHLPFEIRQRIVDAILQKNERITYRKIRKWMMLDSDVKFKNCASENEDRELVSMPAWKSVSRKLSKSLVDRLLTEIDLCDAVLSALTYASSKESLLQRLQLLELNATERDEISQLPFNSSLFSGYGMRSLKALRLLNDSFADAENICTLADAEEASGLRKWRNQDQIKRETFLPLYIEFDPNITNPVVHRVMAQVRAVVNAIIREYGSLNMIRVELARELKHSKKEKLKIIKQNNEIEATRHGVRKTLKELYGVAADVDDKDLPPEISKPIDRLTPKCELLLQQSEQCIYCGKGISLTDLYADEFAYQVDHILPLSRSADNSRMNKVLVHTSCNQNKQNRTPYEWLRYDEAKWEEFNTRIRRLKGCPPKKVQNLLNINLGEDEERRFIARNLNDTRYASLRTRDYLEKALSFSESGRKRRVTVISGGATAILRKEWGIQKDRDAGHFHHAVDAAVIAATTEKMVLKVARYAEKRGMLSRFDRAEEFSHLQPWPTFSAEVLRKAQVLIPTRKVEHGVTGAVFEDTNYRFAGYDSPEKKIAYLSVRKGNDRVTKKKRNFRKIPSGVVLYGGLAFLRLWWDPTGKVRGRKELGKFYVEPVYLADIPFLDRSDYVPRYPQSKENARVRELWSEVPLSARKEPPLRIFAKDALIIRDKVRRFAHYDTAACAWTLSDPRGILDEATATKGLQIATLHRDELKIISEDVLGKCFTDFLFSENASLEE